MSTRWTSQEDAILRDGVKKRIGGHAIAAKTGRSWAAVHSRAHALGLSVQWWRPWTAAEDQNLRELWFTASPVAIGKKLKRSTVAVGRRATAIGIRGQGTDRESLSGAAARLGCGTCWLRRMLAKAGVAFGVQGREGQRFRIRLPPAIVDAAVRGAAPLSRRPWTTANDAEFTALYGTIPIADLARKLDRTVHTLYRRAIDIGIGGAQRTKESLQQAADRHGMQPHSLRLRLDQAGIPYGYQGPGPSGRVTLRFDPADVDRAVKAFRRTPPGPAPGRQASPAPTTEVSG